MATDLSSLQTAAAKEWNLDPAYFQAIGSVESGNDPNAPDSSAGAVGPMQVMPSTATAMGATNPRDTSQNVYASAKYLSQMLDRYQDPDLAAAAYNAGPGRVDDYLAGRAPLPDQTQAYVPKVAAAIRQFMPASSGSSGSGANPPGSYQVASADTGTMSDASSGPSSSSAAPPADDPFSRLVQAAHSASVGGVAQPAPAAAASASPATGSAPAGAAPSGDQADPFSALVSAAKAQGAQIAPAAPSAAGGTATPTQAPGGQAIRSAVAAVAPVAQTVGAGLYQGGEDVAHTINNADAYVDQNVPALAWVDKQFGQDPAAQAAQQQAEAAAFKQRYAGNVLAGGGRVVGNMLAAAPAVIAGGAGLGALAGGAAELAGGGATMLGRGIQAGADMLGGTASAPSSGWLPNAAVRGTSLAANNALAGAAYSGASSGGSDQPLGNQLATGAEAGALLGPAAGAAGAVFGKAGQIGSALVQPFYQGGREAIVDRVLQKVAAGGPTTPDLTSYVPGSTPTLAQATANPGVAAVERAVQAIRPNQFDALAQANDEARAAALDGVRGDSQSLQDLVDTRSQNAATAYTTAFGGKTTPVDPQPAVDQIDSILASPAGQRDAVQSALGNIRSKLVIQEAQPPVPATALTPAVPGAPAVLQTDPAQLYGIRQQITDLLDPASQSTLSSARLAASQLGQVKDTLDPIIEQGAPGYQAAKAGYAADSQPIGVQQYLQAKSFTNPKGNITLGNVDRVVKAIQQQQALPGVRAADSIDAPTMDTLTGLRSDLQRAGNSSLGTPIGSNTFQNLATNNLLGSMGAPLAVAATALHGPLAGALTYGGKLLYGSQNDAILDTLVNRLMNPNAAGSLTPAAPGAFSNALGGTRALVAPAGSIYLNRLAAPQTVPAN